MLKINASTFLFILEFLLIFLGLTIFLFLQYKKHTQNEAAYREEIEKLKNNVTNYEKNNEELAGLKDMFNELKKKIELIKSINIKLKEAFISLVPEAEKSKEYEQLIADIEKNNEELDMCINTLEKENKELEQKIMSYKNEVHGLSRKLKDSVSKTEFDRVIAEKNGLEVKIEQLEEKLRNKTNECEKLNKDYIWLEKEYNALYHNISEE